MSSKEEKRGTSTESKHLFNGPSFAPSFQVDRLVDIYNRQEKLIKLIESHHPDNWFFDDKERFEGSRIYDLCNFLITEAIELQRETHFKWWKIYKNEGLSKDRLFDEIADLLHVILHIAIEAGMSVDDLYNTYVEKNSINMKRQENRY